MANIFELPPRMGILLLKKCINFRQMQLCNKTAFGVFAIEEAPFPLPALNAALLTGNDLLDVQID